MKKEENIRHLSIDDSLSDFFYSGGKKSLFTQKIVKAHNIKVKISSHKMRKIALPQSHLW